MSRSSDVLPTRGRWSGLLVSVRDADEAAAAVAGGAAIIDVKDPARGPLGAAHAAAAAAVASTVAGRTAWTMACGELATTAAARCVGDAVAALPPGVAAPAAAKAGPSGLRLPDWQRGFEGFATALPAGVEPVAVAYADWMAAASPAPAEIIAAAARSGCRTLLIDTYDKSSAGVVEAAPDLAVWIGRAREAGMAVAVAGRLTHADIGRVAMLGADVIAVRSAVCRGGRLGRVDRTLVAAARAATLAAGVGMPSCADPSERPST